ncbi:MAG: hypothetical protein ACHQNE_03430 [Candidatus Kapaibacterium sp.]
MNAQDSEPLSYQHYNFKKARVAFTLIDSGYPNGMRMIVKREKMVIFRGNFMRVSEKPKYVPLDSTTNAFLFTESSGGMHCCATLYLAISDSTGFRMADTIFLRDGDYKLRDLDGDGKPEVLATIDYFPYSWTSFSGSDYDLSIYSITRSGLREVTRNYPDGIERMIRGYMKIIHEVKPKITKEEIEEAAKGDESGMDIPSDNMGQYKPEIEISQKEASLQFDMDPEYIGELKQELACLLIADISIGREDEGWQVIRKQFPYKGRDRFFNVLKREVAERTGWYKPRTGE